jgi:hypothetical protein
MARNVDCFIGTIRMGTAEAGCQKLEIRRNLAERAFE